MLHRAMSASFSKIVSLCILTTERMMMPSESSACLLGMAPSIIPVRRYEESSLDSPKGSENVSRKPPGAFDTITSS